MRASELLSRLLGAALGGAGGEARQAGYQDLEDETARAANRVRFRASRRPAERRAVLLDGMARIDRQVATLRAKIARLQAMIDAADERRDHLEGHLRGLTTEARTGTSDRGGDQSGGAGR